MPINTVVPYPNFQVSVAYYTDTALFHIIKRIFTTRNQIRKADCYNLNYNSYEMWRIWHNWEQAFVHFGLICLCEADRRNLSYNQDKAESLHSMKIDGRWDKPLWLGWKEFHSSQRGLLLHYGECERLANRILIHCGQPLEHSYTLLKQDQFEIIRQWLDEYNFPVLFNFDNMSLLQAHSVLEREGCPIPRSPYEHFNWDEIPQHEMKITILEPNDSWLA